MTSAEEKPKSIIGEGISYMLATALLVGAYFLGNLAVGLGFGASGNYGTIGGVILAAAQTWFGAMIFVIFGGQISRFSARHIAAPLLGFGVVGLALSALMVATILPEITAQRSSVYEFLAGTVSAGGLTAIGIYVLKNR